MDPTTLEIFATSLFAVAILHTFSVKRFERLAHHYPNGSVGENVFHLFAEVEIVFGLWAGVLLVGISLLLGTGAEGVTGFLEGDMAGYTVNFTEPAFVFAVMTVAATRPVLLAAGYLIDFTAKGLVFLPKGARFFTAALIVGPLLGSFITEPAAMTVAALLLKERYFDHGMSPRFRYLALGILFVNVSIGGTLTHFAAPPVLMVAGTWDWDMAFMSTHFGWKASIAVVINAFFLTVLFAREMQTMHERAVLLPQTQRVQARPCPPWLIVVHLVFLAGVVFFAHHMAVFLGILMFFLGVTAATEEYQSELKLKEALLVGFFLAGLVVLGAFQKWWLQPVLSSMGEVPLFFGSTALTAITDNAALTYLGSLVEGISDPSKYALVAGAVSGGGLTVIANAPNPAGISILKDSFGAEGVSPLGLLAGAAVPTVVALACFWLLPSL